MAQLLHYWLHHRRLWLLRHVDLWITDGTTARPHYA